MKYFLDTEFHESKKPVKFLGITLREIRTIDLISIGIVCEDGREYYAINKDCDIKAIWKDDWLKKNVLPSIHSDLLAMQSNYGKTYHSDLMTFSFKGMQNLLKWHGTSLPFMANEIAAFIYGDDCGGSGMSAIEMAMKYEINDKAKNPEFYAYFADYDWVVFCWIFGRMIELPKGFPMYCRDLKQTLDEKAEKFTTKQLTDFEFGEGFMKHDVYNPLNFMDTGYTKTDLLKKHKLYPKQTNEHNAIADARWNLKLYEFLRTLSKFKKPKKTAKV